MYSTSNRRGESEEIREMSDAMLQHKRPTKITAMNLKPK